jgi:hypothetical protein
VRASDLPSLGIEMHWEVLTPWIYASREFGQALFAKERLTGD